MFDVSVVNNNSKTKMNKTKKNSRINSSEIARSYSDSKEISNKSIEILILINLKYEICAKIFAFVLFL